MYKGKIIFLIVSPVFSMDIIVLLNINKFH